MGKHNALGSSDRAGIDSKLNRLRAMRNSEASTESEQESDMSRGQNEYNPLNDEETHVIVHKGTERPFTGEYTDWKAEGTFICRRCNAPLYRSDDKFDSGCGWPSFDGELPESVSRHTDANGRRTEIVCQNCDGHLGHVFLGEGATPKNTRHCVNSLSIRFFEMGNDLPAVLRSEP
jgi:methionine-R-sulfoxide reductase